jgi:hypothetical protein
MAIVTKLIQDWERILIDTSILCNLITSNKEGVTDPTVLFIRKLIDFLNKQKPANKKERTFLVSTITVTELLVKENDVEKIKKILNLLSSDNVEFIDFDLPTSLRFNNLLYPYLAKSELNELAKNYGFKTHEYMMAREWISKDLMIIVNAIEYGADIILTADKKTMYPSTVNAGIFCVLAFPELFEQFDTAILKYNHNEVKEFLEK